LSIPLAALLSLVSCRLSGTAFTPPDLQAAAEERAPKQAAPEASTQVTAGPRAAEAGPRYASDYSFAGIRVGETLGDVVRRGPFAQICSIEDISEDLSSIIYSGKCDEGNFKEDSTIVLFIAGLVEDENTLPEHIVRSLVWFGDYFDSHTEFAGKASMSRARVAEVLGPSTRSCNIGEDEELLHLDFYAGGTYCVVQGDAVVGYGVGEDMPVSCEDDYWEVLLMVYFDLHTL